MKIQALESEQTPAAANPWLRLGVAILADAALRARSGDMLAACYLRTPEAAELCEVAGIHPDRAASLARESIAHPAGRLPMVRHARKAARSGA